MTTPNENPPPADVTAEPEVPAPAPTPAEARRTAELRLLDAMTVMRLYTTAPDGLEALLAPERPRFDIQLAPAQAFLVLTFLQLALQHPQARGINAEQVRLIAEQIEQGVCDTPLLRDLARRGWDEVRKRHPEQNPGPKLWRPPNAEQ